MDEVIREIHQTRDELASSFQNNVRKLFEHIKELERVSGRPHVRRPPKPVRPAAPSIVTPSARQ
jgi:hypothetical protein